MSCLTSFWFWRQIRLSGCCRIDGTAVYGKMPLYLFAPGSGVCMQTKGRNKHDHFPRIPPTNKKRTTGQ
ncbi:hypothetical protein APS_1554 [Acetobacter pasteurianus subsp. pasteurianus LMG 1262 = NBRC 106471]|nr:hypothetical protein APS_1554 [Acetobacter pasteurianus subsp. pasteurianus LMG 1262 = NBRC 106471]